nr:hypothetical protein [Campylobacterota bacterium]
PIEIEEMLNATPFGSEIYLEEKSSGELYLRIEVMVPAPVENSNLDKNEIIENIPFEEIIVI